MLNKGFHDALYSGSSKSITFILYPFSFKWPLNLSWSSPFTSMIINDGLFLRDDKILTLGITKEVVFPAPVHPIPKAWEGSLENTTCNLLLSS